MTKRRPPKKRKKRLLRRAVPWVAAAAIGLGGAYAVSKGAVPRINVGRAAGTTAGVIAGVSAVRIGRRMFKIKSGTKITPIEVFGGTLGGGLGFLHPVYGAIAIATVLIGNKKSRRFIIRKAKDSWRFLAPYRKKTLERLKKGKKVDGK